LRFSRASTSCRLRSRDDWAARRLRRTRSTRRCSFSSSVLARFLGGRQVLGSGNGCPQDFLFFVGFLSVSDVETLASGDCGEKTDSSGMVDSRERSEGSGDMTSRVDEGVVAVKSGENTTSGVEVDETEGDGSNLMYAVASILEVRGGMWLVEVAVCVWSGLGGFFSSLVRL
jgi:hypothetical protein